MGIGYYLQLAGDHLQTQVREHVELNRYASFVGIQALQAHHEALLLHADLREEGAEYGIDQF